MYCPQCHSPRRPPKHPGQPDFCPNCGANLTIRTPDKVSNMIAALLSFMLPGVGQMCQARYAVGAAFLAGAIFSLLLIPFVIGLLTLPICVIWATVDAAQYQG